MLLATPAPILLTSGIAQSDMKSNTHEAMVLPLKSHSGIRASGPALDNSTRKKVRLRQ